MASLKKQSFKIAFYIRVSTEEQAENPEGSIRNQEDRLRQAVEYKKPHGRLWRDQGHLHRCGDLRKGHEATPAPRAFTINSSQGDRSRYGD